MWYNGGEKDMKPSDFLDMDEVRKAEEDFGKVNAIIRLNIPDYQIGEEVSIYFKDTMMVKGVVVPVIGSPRLSKSMIISKNSENVLMCEFREVFNFIPNNSSTVIPIISQNFRITSIGGSL